MAKQLISTKRVAISKANAQMVLIMGIASFVTIFSLVAAQAMFKNNSYRSKVISQKEIAKKQLVENTKAFSSLVSSYRAFDDQSTNVIGGNRVGTADNDGNNAKIVLDSLPSEYDFPALTSSLEKILTDRKFNVSSITGTDDQLAQQVNTSSPTPTPIIMPFTFSVTGASYDSVQSLTATLQNSIRPIQVDKINLSGGTTDMILSIDAHTYYQPGKSLKIEKKAVK